MRKRNIKVGLFLSTFMVFGFLFVQNTLVEAQIQGFGSACVMNYNECPAGQINLREAIETGDDRIRINGTDFDSTQIIQAIDRLYGGADPGSGNTGSTRSNNNNRAICVPIDPLGSPTVNFSGDIIPYEALLNPQNLEAELENGSAPGFSTRIITNSIRMCRNFNNIEFRASQKDFRTGQIGQANAWNTWGCCPQSNSFDYTFVTIGAGQDSADIQGNSACCAVPSGANPGDANYPHYMDGGRCKSITNADIWGSLTDTLNPATGSVFPYAIKDNQMIWGKSFGYTGSSTNNSELNTGTNQGSPKTCQASGGCAIIPGSSPAGDSYMTTSGEIKVINPQSLTTGLSGLTCNSCYDVDEPMFINNPDGGTAQLAICAGSGSVAFEPLVNNNIADTLAVRKSRDQANKDFIANCRAQGGTPTAIGCIDTTPVGIITWLIRIALGTMGGVALIQLIIVGLRYQQGKDDEIKKAREQLIATITGLAVLVFSVLILRILGVNILDVIPAGTI